MASNFVGIGNVDNCKRWNKKDNTHIQIPRLQNYNMPIVVMDVMDLHATDFAYVNYWLE